MGDANPYADSMDYKLYESGTTIHIKHTLYIPISLDR